MVAAEPVVAAGPRSLWRDRDFALFWSGQAVSLTGSSVTLVALPLVSVITLNVGPLGLGLLEACMWLPFFALALFAGVYVDRHRRRPVLMGTNAVRLVLLALIPLIWALDALSLPVLCAVALVSGACEVLFQTAELAYLPGLVGGDRLLRANSTVEATRFGAQLVGASLAGVLVRVFGPVLALLVDAASYAVSLLMLGAVRHREELPQPAAAQGVRRDIAEGARFVWRSVPIRTVSVQGMILNGIWNASSVPLVLFAIRDVGIGVVWWALLLAAGSIGAVFGAVTAPRFAQRFGYGRAMILVAAVSNIPLVLVPIVDSPMWLVRVTWMFAIASASFGVGVINPLALTIRAKLTPAELLGRVSATTRLMVFSAMPLGAVVGGVMAATLGNRLSLWLTALAAIATVGLLVPVWHLRDVPDARRDVPDALPAPV